ncbi:peptidyl-prolyl cis-trans isomerase G [Trema orientale]|uniref:Peptidyl-prolyl cis-trans isomerase G n=1 Tax=Trema orientale TaxID=63057 RepID=A0A2P5FHW6_TREOI|nr:peptidyl-prolyl cis-trans isomerase G [Trema orientale]
MSRPWLLVCLLLIIVFTSQFEWKPQYGNEIEASPIASRKQQYISEREESVKEKIILSQEKNIQKLNELVQSLREQLLQCRGENEVDNGTTTPLTELLTELERQPLLED